MFRKSLAVSSRWSTSSTESLLFGTLDCVQSPLEPRHHPACKSQSPSSLVEKALVSEEPTSRLGCKLAVPASPQAARLEAETTFTTDLTKSSARTTSGTVTDECSCPSCDPDFAPRKRAYAFLQHKRRSQLTLDLSQPNKLKRRYKLPIIKPGM